MIQDPKPSALDRLSESIRPSLGEQDPSPVSATPALDAIGSQFTDELVGESYGLDWWTKSGANALTKFADGAVHAVGLTFKGASALKAAQEAVFDEDETIYEGLQRGWQSAGSALNDLTGSRDPGAQDVGYGIAAALEGQPVVRGIEMGRFQDAEMQKKLGQTKILSDTLGILASFGAGPGRVLGEASAQGGVAVAKVAERAIAKAVIGKKLTPDAAQTLIDSGRVWDWVASQPSAQFGNAASRWLLEKGGKSIQDLGGLTAANVAQSYAMSPEDQRHDAMLSALKFSPLAIPVMKAGQGFAKLIMSSGMDDASKAVLRESLERMESGQVSPVEEMRRLRAERRLPGFARTEAANIIAAAAESTGFLAIDPHMRDLAMKRFLDGDMDAGQQLNLAYLGTFMGVLGLKHLVPQDVLPYFRQVRPDLNRIETYLEAEAIKRAGERAGEVLREAEPEPQGPRQIDPSTGVVMERHKPTGIDPETRRNLEAQGADQRIDPTTLRAEEMETRDPSTGVTMPKRSRAEEVYRKELATQEQDLRARYGWADPQTTTMLEAGWKPEFRDAGTDVYLSNGKDSQNVRMSQDGSLEIGDHELRLLSAFGRPVAETESAGVGRHKLTGGAAKKTLDDLALMQLQRKLQGDLTYSRLGFDERGEYGWFDPQSGRYYSMGLDGKSYYADEPTTGKLSGREDLAVVGGYGDPIYDSPNLQVLAEAFAAKRAVSPDPLIDGILADVIMVARHSDSFGAAEIRKLIDQNPDPQAFLRMLTPDGDDVLASQLGGIAAAMTNGPQASVKVSNFLGKAAKDVLARGREKRNQQAEDMWPAPTPSHPVTPPEPPVGPNTVTERSKPRGYYEATRVKRQERAAEIHELAVQAKKDAVVIRLDPTLIPALREFVAKDSKLAKEFDRVEPLGATGKGDVTVTASDLDKLATRFERYGPELMLRHFRNLDYESGAQRIDAVIQKGLDALLAKPTLAEKTGAPEPGTIIEQGMGNVIPRAAREAAGKAARTIGSEVVDYTVETLPMAIRKRGGDEFATKAEEAISRASKIKGEATEMARKAEDVTAKLSPAPRGMVGKLARWFRKDRAMNKAAEIARGDAKEGTGETMMQALLDRTMKPRNDAERAALDAWAEVQKFLGKRMADAGIVRGQMGDDGQPVYKQVDPKEGKAFVRIRGDDWAKLEGDPALLRELAQHLIDKNPDYMETRPDQETGKVERRRLIVEEMVEVIKGEASADVFKDAEKVAALEMGRRLKYFPAMFKGLKLLESRPGEYMRRLINSQSYRAATGTVFGQEVPEPARQAMLKDETTPVAVRESLQRGGIKAVIERAKNSMRYETAGQRQSNENMVNELAMAAQGGQTGTLSTIERMMQAPEGFIRANMVVLSPLLDVPAAVIDPLVHVGLSRTIKAVNSVFWNGDFRHLPAGERLKRSVQTAVDVLHRDGLMMRELGGQEFRNADSFLQAITDAMSTPGRISEQLRTVMLDASAKAMLDSWQAGKFPETGDRLFVQEVLGMNLQQTNALLSGKAPEALQTQFRQAFTTMIGGRGPVGTGSRLANSPRANLHLRFQRFFLRRALLTWRTMATLGAGYKAYKATGDIKPVAVAMAKSLKLLTGYTVAGMAGQALYYAVGDMLRGDGVEAGLKRWWDELSYAVAKPAERLLGYLGGQAAAQVVGGPLAGVVRVASDPGNADNWARLTAATQAFKEVVSYAAKDVPYNREAGDALWTLAQRLGTVPGGRLTENARQWVGSWMGGAGAADDHALERTLARKNAWARKAGIPRVELSGDDGKADLRVALGELKAVARKHIDDPEAAIREGTEALQRALGMGTAEQVAAMLDGGQTIKRLTNEQREDLAESLNDDREMERLYAYDRTLRGIADSVRKMKGLNPMDAFDERLEAARSQVKLGAGDAWTTLVDDALADGAEKLLAGQPQGDQLDRLAEAMSPYPEQLDAILSDRQLAAAHRMGGAQLARFLSYVFQSRIRDRAKTKQRAAAKEVK